MRFSRIRLNGFKSFVEATEVLIEPGLTGIVGPNGCGKSNVVEGLRWAMGETSAKQLRGGDMYDVIFAGSANRSARNVADVTITLDNSLRQAPSGFNDTDELVISRRIERDKGSVYRINGRDVRARDVQLLFADAATGARSPALVSQGKIGALINAKPAERRVLLEDAAGIGGLHARRHEAELKLRQAETNLARLDDVLGTLESQVNSLTRQVRQAQKYRELSQEIRKLDALRHHIRWLKARQDIAAAESTLNQSTVKVAEAAQTATAADTARAHAAADLPPLRQAEAEAGVIVTRLEIEVSQLSQEQDRLMTARAEAQERAAQMAGDLAREQRLVRDAEVALDRLQAEITALEAATQDGDEAALAVADQHLVASQQDVAELQTTVDTQTEALAQLDAQQRQLRDTIAQTQAQLSQAEGRVTRAADQLTALAPEDEAAVLAAAEQVAETEQAVQVAAQAETEAVAKLEAARIDQQAVVKAASEQADGTRSDNTKRDAVARQAVDQARDAARQRVEAQKAEAQTAREAVVAQVTAAQAEVTAATETAQTLKQDHATLQAEADALSRLLSHSQVTEQATPLIASLSVHEGYEAALGAVLGAEATAGVFVSQDQVGQGWWFADVVPPAETGFLGRQTLADVVDFGVDVTGLRYVLQHVALVADGGEAASLAAALKPGQAVVTAQGHLWRWDGYRSDGSDGNAASEVLRQQNRLQRLSQELTALDVQVQEAEDHLTTLQSALADAEESLSTFDTQQAQDLAVLEQSLMAAEEDAKQAWETVRTENSMREADAAMAVRTARQQAEALEQMGRQDLQALRRKLGAAQAAERQARNDQRQILEQASKIAQTRATHEEALRTAQADVVRLSADMETLSQQQIGLMDREDLAQELADARDAVTQARQKLAQAEADKARLADTLLQRAQRLSKAQQEQQDWQGRQDEAAEHVATLTARLKDVEQTVATLEVQPEEMANKRDSMARQLEEATAKRAEASRLLTEKEEHAVALERASTQARDTLQSVRESHVRAEAALEQARSHLTDVLTRIEEDMAVPPQSLADEAGVDGDPALLPHLPSTKQAELDLDRVKRQRDAIGPVNLRAEVELEEIEEQFAGLRDEKVDLEEAIAKLRTAIEEINVEGRERLLKAFEVVNTNFADLFNRLFGGGSAHLTLIENEDPLAAGLEVMASPPGKKLQSMSLLSGGEQALTALSLLFAVFLVNPAPICVLDEVDAPLDDANVERFCNLLDQMAKYRSGDQETRFLVVSHHPLTMARMNRLFGVTMSERGVSTLVSVDLERAENIRQTA